MSDVEAAGRGARRQELVEAVAAATAAERAVVDAVNRYYEAGATLAQVGEALGMTHEGARRLLHRSGAKLRPA
ncbi:MAG TPA: sigma factor-like helix-turn-helix DNA-binding protein, partial [Actinomycetota bacterium]|nr:sigma factor-like helix-turn-helix DNA-binding protein [Actinomycetota bacterium]